MLRDLKSFTQEEKKQIHDYCKERWGYYQKMDGAYYPSKHDVKVINDAANHYGISYQDADDIFMEISKAEADQMVKGMSKTQMVNLFDSIIKGNADTPWGQMELKNKKK